MVKRAEMLMCNLCFVQADLISTIGESAAMGTAGVVIWEKRETKTEVNASHINSAGP